MAPTPFEPMRHLDNMRREWDRFLTGDFGGLRRVFGQNLGGFSIDLYETENEVVATCDVPGLEKKEDVNIEIQNDVLTISGTVNRVNEVRQENMHRQERYVGRFHRSVNLPTRVSQEGTRATYRNGVLEIRMPKAQPDPTPRIDVDFH